MLRTSSKRSAVVREIKRKTRTKYSSEAKIRIVLEGLRGERSIAPNLYYSWSKEFLEAGKRRLIGDTQRQANSGEVSHLKKENSQLKERGCFRILALEPAA